MKSTIALLVACVPLSAFAGEDTELRKRAGQLFGRVEAPAPTRLTTPEAELGRALFWDTRVSLDGKTACGTCHSADDWSADRRRVSVDARGAHTSRHSQTIFNSMARIDRSLIEAAVDGGPAIRIDRIEVEDD